MEWYIDIDWGEGEAELRMRIIDLTQYILTAFLYQVRA
jgi:hypothetical protein